MKIPGFRIGRMLVILITTALPLALLSSPACADVATKAARKPANLKQSYTWYDGSREHKVWMNPQLVAEFNPRPQGEKSVKRAYSSAKVLPLRHQQAGIRIWQVDNTSGTAPRNIKAKDPQGKYSAVLHDGPNSGSRMRALPGNIIIYLDPQWNEAAANGWLNAHRLEVVKKLEIGPNIYLIKTGPGLEALDTANALYRSGEVKAAFPDWWQEAATR